MGKATVFNFAGRTYFELINVPLFWKPSQSIYTTNEQIGFSVGLNLLRNYI